MNRPQRSASAHASKTARRQPYNFSNRGGALATAAFAAWLLALPQFGAAQEYSEQIAPPPPLSDEEVLEPEVTIRKRGEDTVEEYRVNGHLYMVKVTPSIGPSYYLVDRDGNGLFDKQMSQVYEDFRVPQWVLFSW